jgi:hypothetical protein
MRADDLRLPARSQHRAGSINRFSTTLAIDQIRSIVSAMGGNLIIIAEFEDWKLELSHIVKSGDSRKCAGTGRPRQKSSFCDPAAGR